MPDVRWAVVDHGQPEIAQVAGQLEPVAEVGGPASSGAPAAGNQIVKQVARVTSELEARWRREIGARDYDCFRDVLARLAGLR
jgi:hypothetical protein